MKQKNYTIYHIMNRDTEVAIVQLSHDKRHILYQKLCQDGLLQPFSGNKLDVERFYRFLQGRCYENGRVDLRTILDKAHLATNNPYDFILLSHGVTYADDFWIKIDDEKLTWNEVKVR